tara:strand:+ start:423 stop:2243 length:1821 start_codon:yes stop_codon:yes gene_type:complete
MVSDIYRDSVSAWHGLIEVGGLEPGDRDADLVTQLIAHLHPGATDLEAVLFETSTDSFLYALFRAIQPFALMYHDILEFFKRAKVNEGQSQWKVSIGDDFVDFQHFQEFLDHWKTMQSEFEIPHLDRTNAFILNSVRIEDGEYEYLREHENPLGSVSTGVDDVDFWIARHDEGDYEPFPASLHPENFPRGLDDMAAITMTAVSIVRREAMNREKLLTEHRARDHRSVSDDALHPWTIAQSETDYWLRSSMVYLATLLTKPAAEQQAFGERLVTKLAAFPRRRIAAEITFNDVETLLSLPAWKKRYEFYGVWVATQIVHAVKDHNTTLYGKNGEMKFAFSEARIADFTSARPSVSLYSERKIKATHLIGKKRQDHVQPDFGLWASGGDPQSCKLIIEVKHYKKRSRENFRAALHDYARAHPKATVLLVNYGPVGAPFDDLPKGIEGRCTMIEHLRPDEPKSLAAFHELVREQVGDPVLEMADIATSEFADIDALVIDVSASMTGILSGDWFKDFIEDFAGAPVDVILADHEVKTTVPPTEVRTWLANNPLGKSTSLAPPTAVVLTRHRSILLLTDQDGLTSLCGLEANMAAVNLDSEASARLLRIYL